ncbi:MAG: hypothetical protein Q8S01_05235, partial [Ignavibacteria bacterium]|nr:hypothetical protein [Ignavibacteria bacterium]
KIYRTLLFFLFAVLLSSSLSAQVISSFELTIFKPLPELDLGSLSMANDLSGAPRVFQISILPVNKWVVLEGTITWTDIGQTSSKQIFYFKTRAFRSTTFYNTDLGSTAIRIARTNADNSVINDLARRGKPVGRFDINLFLNDSSGNNRVGYQSDFVEFINPTQSFTIISPEKDTEGQIGNILVSWTQVGGSDHYKIKVNKRTNSNQSLENALASPSPYIDFANIPNSNTSIRLSDLPTLRPLQEGLEYVVQVVAVIKLPNENKDLPSEIVNFHIAGSNDARDNAIKNSLMGIMSSLPGGATLASVFSDRNLRITRLVGENGNPISQDQLTNLLNYFNIHPERVISAQFIYNDNQ